MIREIRWVAAAVAMGLCWGAVADDLLMRRPGLWVMTTAGGPAQGSVREVRMCLDAATDRAMMEMGASAGMCSKSDIHRSGDTITIDSVCKIQTSVMTSHTVAKMTGDTAYHGETTTTMRPPLPGAAGAGTATRVSDGTWLGACPAGMQPGDISAGGRTFNILKMPQHP